MQLFNRVISNIKERKSKVENGGINGIPTPFERFRSEFPVIEQKSIIQITANTKIGKSQITDFLLLYTTFFFAFDHPDKIRLKIFYFSLEMSKEQKELQLMSHLLWVLSKGKYRISPRDLRSVDERNSLSQDIIDILESEQYAAYFKFFEEHVEIIDSIRNPFGIFKFMREYAKANGIQHTKDIPIIDKETGESVITTVDDYYEANDPDEYVLCIIDHMALMNAEKNGTIRDAMIKFSSDYAITLRNKYRYIIGEVIQQAMSQESNDNMKLGKLKPTLDGFGEAKIIARDADLILGLFSPFRHNIRDYEGYNIEKFRDNIRFMEIIAGREGGGGNVCPLYFDGAVNFFKELPLPNDTAGLTQVYKLLDRIRNVNNIALITFSGNIKKNKLKLTIKKWLKF